MRCRACGGTLYRGAKSFQIDALACRACQKSPAVQMRVLLIDARSRGMDFEAAWPWADSRIRWPHDKDHRHEWWSVIRSDEGREMWRDCYERVPRKAESKLAELSELMAA